MDLELKLGPMRNVLIACFAFVMCICVCVSIITSKIVINEVELNPYEDDLHSDVYEWVELYNHGVPLLLYSLYYPLLLPPS